LVTRDPVSGGGAMADWFGSEPGLAVWVIRELNEGG
jgi:hypothetical protein